MPRNANRHAHAPRSAGNRDHAFFIAVLIGLAAQSPQYAYGRDITIGVIAGITRLGATYGAGIVQGAEMAVRDINAEGGVNGQQLRLMVVDDGGDPARSAVAMRRLVSSNVDLVVGGWGSPQVLANLRVAEQSATPYIVVGATHPGITSLTNRWTVRVIPSDSQMAEQLAQHAVRRLALKRIAVIHDSNAYGIGNRDVFTAAMEKLGSSVVSIEPYQTDDREFRSTLRRMQESSPDSIAIFGTIPAAPAIMNQARDIGIQVRFLGTGGLANDELLALAPKASQGAILASFFDEDADEDARQWSARYRREFSDRPRPPQPVLAAWEYRAIRHIAYPCLKSAGLDRTKLRDCIRQWKGRLFGVGTEVYFDTHGQLVHPPVIVEVRDNSFQRSRTVP